VAVRDNAHASALPGKQTLAGEFLRISLWSPARGGRGPKNDWCLGLVNLVVVDDALEDATFTIAEELAQGSTVAHAATKRLVHIAVNEGVLAADEAMAEIQKPIWASEDLKIGLASFRENGPGLAKFTGRGRRPRWPLLPPR
jgi:hypothetical protein